MTPMIILAAGSSSRMGRPKQNLLFENKTLLQYAVNEARSVSGGVFVVMGANKAQILPTLKHFKVQILENEQWKDGMATSITLALSHIMSLRTETDGVIFLTCDQPYVNAGLLKELIRTAEASLKGIVACAYNETIGVPAYFKRRHFPELQKLKGSEGAKKLFLEFRDDVEAIPFPLGSVDIDTEEDFQKFLSSK